MSIIASYIKKKLEQDIRTSGLLVWLDKTHEFTDLVDTWIEQKKEGHFHYDIFAFRGSFLQLMLDTREIFENRNMPKCVIHMPGFSEKDIKQTPLLEAYKAGKRWRISLQTMIREAAQGRLSEKQVSHLLSQQKLNLSQAETFITDEEDIPLEIQRLIKKYGENGFLLKFIKNPGQINEEMLLKPENCFDILISYFEKLTGLDNHWKKDWNPYTEIHDEKDNYAHPDNQVDLFVSFLMSMEFVHDLQCDPRSDRLMRLKEKQKEYAKKASEILYELREKDSKLYIQLAQQVEANLTPNECYHTSKELGRLDTFCFEADIFLKDAMNLLEQSKWSEVIKLSKSRLPDINKENDSNSFWLKQDRKRLWLWEWIDISAKLGMKATQIIEEVKKFHPDNASHEKLVHLYTNSWWDLDQIHRKFASLSERYQSTHSDLHIKAFIESRKTLHALYRKCIDDQSQLWNQLCQSSGFLPDNKFQQRYFIKNFLQPILQHKKKTAVFFVDALRYELGKELIQELKSMFTQTDISPMLAELPTITSVGMNALVSMVNNSNLSPILNKKGRISGFHSGERQVNNAKNRLKTLKDHVGVETSWIKLNSLFSLKDKDLKKYLNHKLLVVTAQDIDKMGESGALNYAIDYFEKSISRLKTAILKLKDKKYEQFIITADHGFILGDESVETGKGLKMECVERRFAYGTQRNSEQFLSVSLNQLNYSHTDKENFFIFHRKTHLLTNKSQTGFYHGGNTLQERLIPVLSFSLAMQQLGNSYKFSMIIEKKSDDQGFHRIGVCPESINPDLFPPSYLEVQLFSDEDINIEIGDIIGAKRKGDILTLPLKQESVIYFKLRDGFHSKARIYFQTIEKNASLINSECSDYFEVENRIPNSNQDQTIKKSKKKKDAATTYPATIPDEYHIALKHLEKHGSLSEKFLVNTLGNDKIASRKGRRFANKISEWLKDLPFDVYIIKTKDGKEYRLK